MKINAGEIKVGMLLEYKNELWQVLKTQHVKPGKGGAFNQVEMKSINKDTTDSFFDLANIQILSNPFANFSNMTNTQALGSVLYTDYILYFQLSGVILLVAMIGSIVLTLRDRTGVRRQVIGEQLERDSSSTVLKEVESGEGVDI